LFSAKLEVLRDFRNHAMAGRWELIAEQWELVEPILRPARRKDNRGRPWHDTQAVLHGVFWVLGTGAHWSELPAKYPPYQTCHRRFQQWVREGKLELLCMRWRSSCMPEGNCNWRSLSSSPLLRGQKRGPRGRAHQARKGTKIIAHRR
jgi:transposase